mgnify:CR=1 FL=1
MRVSYWGQKAPDADDLVLRKMIEDGVVPPGCLWGGELVRFAHDELREDPCGRCKCPDRPRCGGRPSSAHKPVTATEERDLPTIGSEQVAARRLERAGYIRDVLGMIKPE